MKYQEGSIGRVFVLKIEHEEDFLKCIKEIAIKKDIKCAYFQMIGAIKSADMVTGPKNLELPPEQIWKNKRDEGMELVGIGTIFYKDNEPGVHLHAALGNAENAYVGCIRDNTSTFIVLEVILIELNGINAIRELDKNIGLNVLNLKDK